MGSTQQIRRNQFIESLNDGRQVWIDGEKVTNLHKHPAFEGTLNTIQELFNQLHDPHLQEKVGFVSPVTGEYVHKAFLVPKTKEDVWERKEAFAFWANQTYGMMSRLAESGRSYLTGWYASREMFNEYNPQFSDKISKIYETIRDQNRIIISVEADPQVNRAVAQSEQEDKDLFLRVVKTTKEGVVIRGAKMMATAAPYAHDVIIHPNIPLKEEQAEYANLLIVPLNLPGVHIICRDSFASENKEIYPLSSEYEEMDATIVFDDVLVPWERVLLHHDPKGVWEAVKLKRHNSLMYHQSVIRLVEKLKFVTGIGCYIAKSIGAEQFLNVQERLGELVIQIESIKALLISSEEKAKKDEFGTLWPDPTSLRIAIDLGASYYPRALEILQQVGAGGFLQVPSNGLEQNESINAFIDKYYAGTHVTADEKTKLFRLAWDLIGSSSGARHELYERFFSGDPVRNYATRYKEYDRDLLINRVRTFIKESSD